MQLQYGSIETVVTAVEALLALFIVVSMVDEQGPGMARVKQPVAAGPAVEEGVELISGHRRVQPKGDQSEQSPAASMRYAGAFLCK